MKKLLAIMVVAISVFAFAGTALPVYAAAPVRISVEVIPGADSRHFTVQTCGWGRGDVEAYLWLSKIGDDTANAGYTAPVGEDGCALVVVVATDAVQTAGDYQLWAFKGSWPGRVVSNVVTVTLE